MATETSGTVYSFTENAAGGWLAVKIKGGKVVRFPTDEGPWRLNEEVVVSISRPKVKTDHDEFPELKGFSIDD